MAAILADDIIKCIFLNETIRMSNKISRKFVPEGPIDKKSALFQVMAWRRTGNKPLPEQILTQSTDIYTALGRDELRSQKKQANSQYNYLGSHKCWQ